MAAGADHALFLGLFGVPVLIVIAAYIVCAPYNDLIAIYVITAWLQTFLYGPIWLMSGIHRMSDPYILGLVAGLLTIYLVCFILFGGLLNKYYGLVARVALSIPRPVIFVAFVAWLAFKALLVKKYGLIVFGSLKLRELAGEPHSLVDLDALLSIPAMGAFFTYTIQVAREGRKAIRLPILGLWVAFVIVNLMAEQSGGGKRFMILTALVALLMFPSERFRLRGKTVMAMMIAVVAVAVLSNRYQALRENFPELRHEVTHIEPGKALALLFKPKHKYESLSEDIAKRAPPIDLLYNITQRQLSGTGLADGLLIKQAVLNAAPGILVKKKFVDDDERLAEFFNMGHHDYPTTPLAVLQAECYLPAYILVPAMYVMLLWAYLAMLDRYQARSWLFSIVLIGLAIGTAGEFETSLTGMVSSLRSTIIFWCISEALFRVLRLHLLPAPLREAH